MNSSNNFLKMEINLKYKYFEIQKVSNTDASDFDLLKTRRRIRDRRAALRYHAKDLNSIKPCLFENMINIYFHPEISLLIELLDSLPKYDRKFHLLLQRIFSMKVKEQFPKGDIHSELMSTFIRDAVMRKQMENMNLQGEKETPMEQH